MVVSREQDQFETNDLPPGNGCKVTGARPTGLTTFSDIGRQRPQVARALHQRPMLARPGPRIRGCRSAGRARASRRRRPRIWWREVRAATTYAHAGEAPNAITGLTVARSAPVSVASIPDLSRATKTSTTWSTTSTRSSPMTPTAGCRPRCRPARPSLSGGDLRLLQRITEPHDVAAVSQGQCLGPSAPACLAASSQRA
jgi:hypothetical protein